MLFYYEVASLAVERTIRAHAHGLRVNSYVPRQFPVVWFRNARAVSLNAALQFREKTLLIFPTNDAYRFYRKANAAGVSAMVAITQRCFRAYS